MMTDEMKVWHGVVIAVVSFILQAGLLAATYYLLSRSMANHSERILKEARSQDFKPNSAHHHPPANQESNATQAERNTLASDLHYRLGQIWLSDFLGDGSDTSSDNASSSSSSGSSDRLPRPCQAIKDINYTQVVFSEPGGKKNGSTLDYENMKKIKDYVNVSPKVHKHIWTFTTPADSEPLEYTQVAL